MNRTVAWLVAAVLTSAAAGVAAGIAACQVAHAATDVELQTADRETLARYVADLQLRGEQVTLLRAILRTLRDDEARIYSRNHSRLPASVQDELAGARRAADARIEFMLDAKQRTRYDQLRPAEPGKPGNPSNR
ncbi:MAG: hypothetical protein R3F56_12420 [Planctomycetota bacterium]